MKRTLTAILNLLSTQGQVQYGREAVSQLEHALQSATLAAASHRPELVAASLLHDIGHLVDDLGQDITGYEIDDRHEYRALPLLKSLLPPAVTEPIRLHVDAKRYLCAVNPGYWANLSPASQHSLELQGGVFPLWEAEQFMQQPYARDAVQLRMWDDRAKVTNLPTPELDHFLPILIQLCIVR
jgi:phosphonate degradation associated HDIG domain protein